MGFAELAATLHSAPRDSFRGGSTLQFAQRGQRRDE